MKHQLKLQNSILIALGLIAHGCGSSDSSTSGNYLAVPVSLSVASVTSASTSDTSTSRTQVNGTQSSSRSSSKPSTVARKNKFKRMTSDLSDRISKSDVADCLSGLELTIGENTEVSCYGPSIAVKNHPDDTTADATTLPVGDLGIWSASTTETGEACSATKANALIADNGKLANESLAIMAGMVCVAKAEGTDLSTSEAGTEVSVLTSMNKLVSGTKLATASVKFVSEDTANGTRTYETKLEGMILGLPMVLTLDHTTNSDGTVYSGRMYGNHGAFDRAGTGTVNPTGFSIVYNLNSTSLNYVMKSAQASSLDVTFHDSSNNVDFSADGFEHQANYTRAEIDTSTGLGTLYHAWQAGRGDGYSRVFQVTASADSSGTESAFSYFGYGPDVTESTVGDITGMICNWTAPGATKTVQTGKAQAQVMTRSGDYFVSSADSILYAPTNSCDNASSDFSWASSLTETYTAFGTITNELATYGDSSIGTIPTVTEATY